MSEESFNPGIIEVPIEEVTLEKPTETIIVKKIEITPIEDIAICEEAKVSLDAELEDVITQIADLEKRKIEIQDELKKQQGIKEYLATKESA